MHFMPSSKGIIIVLAISVCASSITGGLMLSVSLMWLASLLGVPIVVGALATCRVALLEGPPTDAWFPGAAGAAASRRPKLHTPLRVGLQGALELWAQLPQPWTGIRSLPLLLPWLHFLHVKNLLTFRCTTVCISGVPTCWVEKKKKLY